MKETLKLGLEALQNSSSDWAHQVKAHQQAITAIEAVLAQPEQETQAYREAAQLAKWLFKKHYAQEEHYKSGRVVWGLCDTTAGVISQIDNMVCKLVLPKEPEQEPVEIAWLKRLKFPTETGAYEDWKVCSHTEATNPFKQMPNFEYKKFYTTPPQPDQKIVGTVGDLFDERVISKRELDRDLLVYIAQPKENT